MLLFKTPTNLMNIVKKKGIWHFNLSLKWTNLRYFSKILFIRIKKKCKNHKKILLYSSQNFNSVNILKINVKNLLLFLLFSN